jgi:hypothetical protein
MIYIEKSKLVEGDISLIHYQPFDSKNGLGKTQEELEMAGVFVDSLPIAEILEGKIPMLKINANNQLFYEYEDAPPSEADRISQLEKELAVSKADNISNMLAITELYELILGGGA